MAQKLVVVIGVDQTAYLAYGSMTVKLNTCDFTLIDSNITWSPGATIIVKDPGWTGKVVRVKTGDIVDRQTGHYYITVSATNTDAVVARPTPFNLSDNPSAAAASHFLKEDGSGALVLEDDSAFAPGDYALESSTDSYGYRGLSIDTWVNSDQSIGTLATATIFQPGLWPGMTVNVKSANQLFPAGKNYVVTQVTTTWTGGVPTFTVEMGATLTESLPTLTKWRAGG